MSFLQLRKSLKIRYQLISAQNYRGIKRVKHLIIFNDFLNCKKDININGTMRIAAIKAYATLGFTFKCKIIEV
jgi:hypothetical protein